MNLNQYNEMEVTDGKITIAGVTAEVEAWEPLGVRRANWIGVDEQDQPVGRGFSQQDWGRVRDLVLRATDALPTGTPHQIIARAVTLAAADRNLALVVDGMRALGHLSVSVPSNVNVWHHSRGESALTAAAAGLSAAVKALAEK